jgi:predicted MPP superfamily phosphohydrolase/tetratricopeptide (TPR) repeat protein
MHQNQEQENKQSSNEMNCPVRWLHLSDLHMGMSQQHWMWPNFKGVFFDDLKRMHSRNGPWDLIVFSGDLTQRGTKEEFDELTRALIEIWNILKELGSTPSLFVVPGNHDLIRPCSLDPSVKVLTRWWEEEDIHKNFWESKDSPYKKVVTEAFQTYMDWLESIQKTNIKLLKAQEGLLPGDISAIFTKGDIRLGLVGLNSAWLQLGTKDYKGLLSVHPKQLLSVTNNDPDKWCSKNQHNLLITHHPTAWLHSEALKLWNSEINTRTRFDVHLFGHMHEPTASSISEAGGRYKRTLQAASLFGLEMVNDSLNRIHGYSAASLEYKNGISTFKVWPRRSKILRDGNRKIAPDNEWDLNDDNFCEYSYGALEAVIISEPPASQELKIVNNLFTIDDANHALKSIRRSGMYSEAFAEVRQAERGVLIATLENKGAAWLVTDWGLGGDDFIHCVQEQIFGHRRDVYYLDLNRYVGRDAILAGVKEQLGCSFEQLCVELSNQEKCFFVLDDVAIADNNAVNSFSNERDIDEIVDAVLEYCPDIKIIVRSRKAPIKTSLRTIKLYPLDEADTATYILNHERGDSQLARSDAVARIFRHTDGIPYRIDAVLRDIQFVGMQGLYEIDTDVAGKSAVTQGIPQALIEAVQELASSEDEVDKRAFSLLKVLTLFPRGEQLERVKRFYGSKAFWPAHVAVLRDHAFVDAVIIPSLGGTVSDTNEGKAFVVRRPVREYLYKVLTATEVKNISRRALSLYFGENWKIRGIKSPADLKFKDPQCGVWEIGNASTLILRVAKTAVDSNDAASIKDAVILATVFCAALKQGNHFRNITSLLDDLVPLFESTGIEINLLDIRYQLASALRMIGHHDRAKEILISIDESKKASIPLLGQVLLTLSLLYQSGNENEKAILLSKRCIEINPKSMESLQAKSILIQLSEEDNIISELRVLEEEAIKRKAYVLVNNLAIERAKSMDNSTSKYELLENVFHLAKQNGDTYNSLRGLLGLAKILLNDKKIISQPLISSLIQAYSYLYNQRIDTLFNDCHQILWRFFVSTNDAPNLLRLFRHSSLIWRLRGQTKIEQKHVGTLSKLLGERTRPGFLTADREIAYFLSRGINLLDQSPLNSNKNIKSL